MLQVLTALAVSVAWLPQEPPHQRETFVDAHRIQSLEGDVVHELGTPRDAGVVLRFDRPWEGPFCGYATVLRDPAADASGRYLLFYRGLPTAGGDNSAREVTCVARSADGVEWQRPTLGLHRADEHPGNNIVLADVAPATHNFSPFLDTNPECAPEARFKALGGSKKSGLIAWTSSDGVHWRKLQEEPVFRGGMLDSQNVAFWSALEQRYVCYYRTWTGQGYSGVRSVGRATSKDFVRWTTGEQMDFGEGALEHIYTNQTHPYHRNPNVYVAIAARFMPGRQVLSEADAKRLGVNPRYFKDCSDAVLMTSRGGNRYDRTFREGFLRPGLGLQNWVSRSNYPALNVVPTGEHEMSIYVNQNYAQPTAELRRYALRVDDLAHLRAGARGGTVVTTAFDATGQSLAVNFATSAAGGIFVDVLDRDGTPLPGRSGDAAIELVGNDTDRAVVWRGDVVALPETEVRLRFRMRDAVLYSFTLRR